MPSLMGQFLHMVSGHVFACSPYKTVWCLVDTPAFLLLPTLWERSHPSSPSTELAKLSACRRSCCDSGSFRKHSCSTPHHCLTATFAFGRKCISSFSCLSLPISGSLICLILCLHRPCSIRLQRPCWCEQLPITSTPKGLSGKMLYDSVFPRTQLTGRFGCYFCFC